MAVKRFWANVLLVLFMFLLGYFTSFAVNAVLGKHARSAEMEAVNAVPTEQGVSDAVKRARSE